MNSENSRTVGKAANIQASFTFICPHCEQRLEAEPDMVGMELKCPTCALPITVPAPVARKEVVTNESVDSLNGGVPCEIENSELGNVWQHSMIVSCPQCGHKWECDDSFDGVFGECPACGKGFILSSDKPKAAKSPKSPLLDKVGVNKNEDVAETFKFSRLIPLAICCLGFGWLSVGMPFVSDNVIYASNRWQILPISALALFGSFCGIRHFLRPQKIQWDILIAVCLFTAFVGMKMLFEVQYGAAYAAGHDIRVKGQAGFFYSILRIIGQSYNAVNNNQGNFLDWIVSVGFCEESVKLLPLLLLLAFRNKLSLKIKLSFRTFLLLGFFSGLGFGIAEALSYQYCLAPSPIIFSELAGLDYLSAIAKVIGNINAAVANWKYAIEEYIHYNSLSGQLTRWFACVPSHAIYTVVDAACLWILYKRILQSPRLIEKFLWFAACVAVIATLHGIYDKLCGIAYFGIVLNAASFVLMWWIVRLASSVKIGAGNGGLAEAKDMETQSVFTGKSLLMTYFAIAIAIVVYASIMCKPANELREMPLLTGLQELRAR